ncbi:MAG TPA: hypothetical protein V6C76_11300 [Drouetiella sp.]
MNTTPQMIKETTMKDHWIVPLALVLISCPTWLTLTTSPTLFAIPAAIFGIWYFHRAGHWFLAGLLTAICLFRPEFLPFMIVPGLILGRFFYLGGLAVSGIAVYFAAQFMHLDINLSALMAAAVTGPANMMQNFAGILTLLLGENASNLSVAVWAIYGITLACVTELWWRMKDQSISQNKYLKKCAGTILMMLLAAPHTYAQDYVAFIPVAIWLWNATKNDSRSNATTIRRMIFAFPLVSWLFYFAAPTFVMLRIPPYFIWALALSLVLLPTLDDERVVSAK